MAERPIFLHCGEGDRFVVEKTVSFQWHPGLAVSQKHRCVLALHEAAREAGFAPLLEVSSKSERRIGIHLSAFNLSIELSGSRTTSLESAFQGSKIFEGGGPFQDIYNLDSRSAKTDERLRNSGRIVGFKFGDIMFPAHPMTAFYDWLYTRALAPHRAFLSKLERFAGFTDIEFNPKRSLNCQARSCALFVSLSRRNLLDSALLSPSHFIETIKRDAEQQPYAGESLQGSLF